jgi:peptide/nickel transport system permease protein
LWEKCHHAFDAPANTRESGIRGDILTVKEREYVTAARVIGVRKSAIMFRHILPNAIFPILVYATMDIGSYVLSFAALSFLGVGIDMGYSDWRQLLSFSRNWITALDKYWYIVVWPGIALILYCLAWNLVGDALRDALDPRMRGTKWGRPPETRSAFFIFAYEKRNPFQRLRRV